MLSNYTCFTENISIFTTRRLVIQIDIPIAVLGVNVPSYWSMAGIVFGIRVGQVIFCVTVSRVFPRP